MTFFEKLAAAAWSALAGFSVLDQTRLLPENLLERAVLCPFHAITGIPCPGCGMTRGIVAGFEGRFADSVAYHPLALPLLALWTAWLLAGLFNRSRNRPFSAGFPDLASGRKGWALVALVLAVYGARLIPA